MEILDFWKSHPHDLEEMIPKLKKGRWSVLTESGGKRPINLIEYGQRTPERRTANFSSAVGCNDISRFKNHPKPHILILCGVHGGEWEGSVSALNLIHIFETGTDFRGKAYPELEKWQEKAYIAIIPFANPDGRERIPYRSVVGMKFSEFRKWNQGVDKAGNTYDWPQCKAFHPMKEYSSFLGGYFNDDGVNLMHDNFFRPMAAETDAILRLTEEISADFVLDMHGHAGMEGDHILPAQIHTPPELEKWFAFEDRWEKRLSDAGYSVAKYARAFNPNRLQYNLETALYLQSGAMTACYESDQGVISKPEDEEKLSGRHERILEKHLIFYEEIMRFAQEIHMEETK